MFCMMAEAQTSIGHLRSQVTAAGTAITCKRLGLSTMHSKAFESTSRMVFDEVRRQQKSLARPVLVLRRLC
jgi:hypothetical protein